MVQPTPKMKFEAEFECFEKRFMASLYVMSYILDGFGGFGSDL